MSSFCHLQQLDITDIIIWSFGIRIIANHDTLNSKLACKLPQLKICSSSIYTELYSLWLGYE